MLTPLPGSKDHQELYRQGVQMSSDLNNYDVEHAVTAHAGMTAAEWQSIYDQAWHLYYSPEHIATLLRRAKVSGIRTTRLAFTIFYFYASYAFEHVHPLQSGVLRRKNRKQRRCTYPRENIAAYLLRRTRDFFGTYPPGLRFLWRLELLRRKIEREPNEHAIPDLALEPITDEYGDGLELFNATESARHAADQAIARANGHTPANQHVVEVAPCIIRASSSPFATLWSVFHTTTATIPLFEQRRTDRITLTVVRYGPQNACARLLTHFCWAAPKSCVCTWLIGCGQRMLARPVILQLGECHRDTEIYGRLRCYWSELPIDHPLPRNE